MKRYFANRERQLDLDKAVQAELRLRILAIDYLHRADGTEASAQTLSIEPFSMATKRKGGLNFEADTISDEESSHSSQDDEPLEFQRPQRSSNLYVTKARTQAETKRTQTIQLGEQLDSDLAKQPELDVDDTDGLDPEAEFADWRQRERQRVEREYKNLESAEQEMQRKLEARRKRLKNTLN